MHVMTHNWSSTKQRLHPQSVAKINHHSVLAEDKIQQCKTSSGSCHKADVDEAVTVLVKSVSRHFLLQALQCPCSVRKHSNRETTVAEGGQNPVAGLWGRTLDES